MSEVPARLLPAPCPVLLADFRLSSRCFRRLGDCALRMQRWVTPGAYREAAAGGQGSGREEP